MADGKQENAKKTENGQERHQHVLVSFTKVLSEPYFLATFTLGVNCGAPTVSESGYYTGNTTYQSTIKFGCDHGYYLDGATNANCLYTKAWDKKAPKCIRK